MCPSRVYVRGQIAPGSVHYAEISEIQRTSIIIKSKRKKPCPHQEYPRSHPVARLGGGTHLRAPGASYSQLHKLSLVTWNITSLGKECVLVIERCCKELTTMQNTDSNQYLGQGQDFYCGVTYCRCWMSSVPKSLVRACRGCRADAPAFKVFNSLAKAAGVQVDRVLHLQC